MRSPRHGAQIRANCAFHIQRTVAAAFLREAMDSRVATRDTSTRSPPRMWDNCGALTNYCCASYPSGLSSLTGPTVSLRLTVQHAGCWDCEMLLLSRTSCTLSAVFLMLKCVTPLIPSFESATSPPYQKLSWRLTREAVAVSFIFRSPLCNLRVKRQSWLL